MRQSSFPSNQANPGTTLLFALLPLEAELLNFDFKNTWSIFPEKR
jgi:hypothetical protein